MPSMILTSDPEIVNLKIKLSSTLKHCIKLIILKEKKFVFIRFNPFLHTAILQQTTIRKTWMFTLLKEMNIFFKLESFKEILQEQFLPLSQCFQMMSAGAISSFATMFSNDVCCSKCKNKYLWNKGLTE